MECQQTALSFLSWGLIVGGVAFLLHQIRICALYGRYTPTSWRCCPARLGWFLQEVPSLLVPLLLLLHTEQPDPGPGRTLLLCTFMLHYFYRSEVTCVSVYLQAVTSRVRQVCRNEHLRNGNAQRKAFGF